jgi:hypothetical protein
MNAPEQGQGHAQRRPQPRGVGARLPLVDGVEKVTGTARYTADLPAGGALVGLHPAQPLRPCRTARSRHLSEALALPGVRAVITGDECDMPYGVIPIAQNEFPLARDKVRYIGDPIAAVAAVDEATAAPRWPIRLRRCANCRPTSAPPTRARPMPCCCTKTSRATSSARCITSSATSPPVSPRPTWCARTTYECAEVHHAMMEPNAALAAWDTERGHLTLWSVTQVPYYVHLTLARCMKMEAAHIRVIKPFVGGGFGHRTECAQLRGRLRHAGARRARHGAPAANARGSFLAHRGRPESQIRIKLGLKRDGASPPARPRWCSAAAPTAATAWSPSSMPARCSTALRHPGGQVRRLPRLHQHAGLRRHARPRHGEHPLRLRIPARRWPPNSASTRSPCAGATCCRRRPHHQRPAGHVLRPARMPRLGRGGQRLAARKGKLGRQRQHRQGPRHGLLALRQRLGQAGALVGRAARGDRPQARLRRR